MQCAARSSPHQRSRSPRRPEHELRADGVGGRGEQAAVVDREEARERAEGADDAGRRGRGDGAAEAIDDRVRGRERHPRGGVRLLGRGHETEPSDPPGSSHRCGTIAPMTADDVQRWLDAYVAAWASYDEAEITALFTDDCAYRYDPFCRSARRRRRDRGRLAEGPGRAGIVGGGVPRRSPSTAIRAVAVGETRYPQESKPLRATRTCSSSPPTAAAARSPSGSSSSGSNGAGRLRRRPARTAASCGRRRERSSGTRA